MVETHSETLQWWRHSSGGDTPVVETLKWGGGEGTTRHSSGRDTQAGEVMWGQQDTAVRVDAVLQ